MFVRFVNMLLNDAQYLLDESLSNLTAIHNFQEEVAQTETWESLSVEVICWHQSKEGSNIVKKEVEIRILIQLALQTTGILCKDWQQPKVQHRFSIFMSLPHPISIFLYQVREERTTAHARTERMASSFMSMANETVHMIHYFTRDIPSPFLEVGVCHSCSCSYVLCIGV